jgi:K+-transporting ATPase KdpF subunit
MPAWLATVCAVAVVLAAGYLLYVVLNPEKF